MRIKGKALFLSVGFAVGAAQQGAAEAPLSAIDWLSNSVTAPAGTRLNTTQKDKKKVDETPVVKGGALPEQVAVIGLDAQLVDGFGLLSSTTTGLPRNLWGLGKTNEIIAAIRKIDTSPGVILPSLSGLVTTLLLAEASPPVDSSTEGQLLLARVDWLLSMGALDPAIALMKTVPAPNVELFRRSFDAALLTGTESEACDKLFSSPDLAPTFAVRVFCLARSGDWNAAALTLRTAEALNQLSPKEDALLTRFLDPDVADEDLLPPLPNSITPLDWRLMEAVGDAIGTKALPLAFAHAELMETAGWKAQIEAAERLARVGAISPNVLLSLYTERLPAASGGVWDRVDAFQRFETALSAGDPGAVAKALPIVWQFMSSAELEVPFSLLFAQELAHLPLTGEAASIAFRIGLLAPNYEATALIRKPESQREAFLIGLAKGDLTGATPPDSLSRAIAPAFTRPSVSVEMTRLLDQNRTGEAILAAVDRITRGVQGNLDQVTEGLSILRMVGLEDMARRTAIQLLVLERRG